MHTQSACTCFAFNSNRDSKSDRSRTRPSADTETWTIDAQARSEGENTEQQHRQPAAECTHNRHAPASPSTRTGIRSLIARAPGRAQTQKPGQLTHKRGVKARTPSSSTDSQQLNAHTIGMHL